MTWTTVFDAPVGIEGLTVDRRGNLYAPGRVTGAPCPVFKVSGNTSAVVGNLPAPCNPAGLAFGPDGRLYIGDSGRIMVLRPDAGTPPTAEVYATDVPGSNGLAWDRRGDLWVTDGGTAQGRVWRIGRDRVPVEMFRIQPLANDVLPTGIGRDNRGLPPGEITITPTGRQASNILGSQHLVANGIAFTKHGDAVVADTARGAIWLIRLDHRGRVLSRTGCDTTFTANTLCLDNVLVQHPYLDGADGIVLDDDDNIYVAANERNAIAVVTDNGRGGRALPQPRGRRSPAQRGPARVPDQPGAGGPQAVRDQLRRSAARQLPRHARRGGQDQLRLAARPSRRRTHRGGRDRR